MFIFLALSVFSKTAWAYEDIYVVVNHTNKVDHLTKKQIQDFYLGKNNKYRNNTKVRFCMNSSIKGEFLESIDLSENRTVANKAQLRAVGRAETVVEPQNVIDSKDVLKYIKEHPIRGMCFISKEEYLKLNKEERDLMKVVYQPNS
jgi:hypothetical protein